MVLLQSVCITSTYIRAALVSIILHYMQYYPVCSRDVLELYWLFYPSIFASDINFPYCELYGSIGRKPGCKAQLVRIAHNIKDRGSIIHLILCQTK